MSCPHGTSLLPLLFATAVLTQEAKVTVTEDVLLTEPRRLRRLWPGPQRLFVAAEDHQSAIVDITVPPTGRTSVKVVLPKR